jgi:hypothetical protein
MEPDFWGSQPTASGAAEKRRASGVFTPSKKNLDKKVTPIISRAEKLKNFKYLAQCAEKYFTEMNEASIIPPNF